MADNQKQAVTTLVRQTRLMDKLERSFALSVRREKNRFVEAQANYYKRTRQLSDVLLTEHEIKLKAIFRKHYGRTLRVFSGDTIRNLPTAKSIYGYEKKRSLFDLLLSEWVNEQGAQRVKNVARTTYKDLRKVLLAGIESEEPAGGIIKRLLQVRAFSAFRAATIARTEVHSAAMFASKRTAQIIAQDVGITILKRWVPALDERTRFSHKAMRNHKPVGMEASFKVGRPDGGHDSMDRPGDPSGSAGNVINCRCVLVYEEA